MSRRQIRRRAEKTQRQAAPPIAGTEARAVVRVATHVERLAYTRSQAAEALGVSTSTFNRRVLPFIEMLQMDWGPSLVPVDELERLVAARRQKARARQGPPARPGRRAGLPPAVVASIRDQATNGRSFGEIARGLNADGVPTSQGGRQWWPSTVRAVLVRAKQPDPA
jgi:hypothetical protein